MKHYLLIFLITLMASFGTTANNLQIGIPTVNASNELVFTLSWDNSWRTNSAPTNWDAIYLFAKYRDCASTGAWNHVEFSTTYADHFAAVPLEIHDYLLDGKGIMVRAGSVGSGSITTVTIRLKISTPANNASYDFRVFGIEMVYIPTGSFYLGDGISSFSFKDGSTTNSPLFVTNDGALTKGTAAGNINSIIPATVPVSIPAAYPLGYDSMYVMKYEISQGQWISFLNTLAVDQASARVLIATANRINVGGSWPNYTALSPYRAMGRLSWQDLVAYLDWSALRPMTETEYEKICRGPSNPVANEYAWGTNVITDVLSVINDGTATEANGTIAPIGSGKANYNNNIILGPMRSGFAGSPTSNRLQSGATYYGVMEMTGNLQEMCINVYHLEGRSFTPTHGDGYLTNAPTAGNANPPTWPSVASNASLGITERGGSYAAGNVQLYTSNRIDYYSTTFYLRSAPRGGRGIR